MQPASGIYDPARAFGDFAIRQLRPEVMALPHWHGHVEINVLSGAAMTYDFDGREASVPDGAAALFWAGIPHRSTRVAPTGMPDLVNIYLPLDRFLLMGGIGSLQADLLGGGVLLMPPNLLSAAVLGQWKADLASGDQRLTGLVETELNAVLRRLSLGKPARALPPRATRMLGHGRAHVVAMVRHIVENLERPLTNGAIAAVTGLNETYALNLFSAVLRVPMRQFVIRMRLSRARSLLMETDLPVATIAAQAGFGSASRFFAAFHRAYGMTPRAARLAGIGAPG